MLHANIARHARRVALVALLAACGNTADDPASEQSVAPPSPAEEESWVASALPPDPSRREVTTHVSCSGFPGTDEELALTPRIDEEAEVLALRVANTFTADGATYERIRRDLASIRTQVPALQHVRGRGEFPGVSLTVEEQTFQAMVDGTYAAWDCLHARYGWEEPSLNPRLARGRVIGRYDMERINALYEQLPGIERASGLATLPGPQVCASREPDESFHYVFDDASDDCQSGCMEHHFYYFVSQSDGHITAKGEHRQATNFPEWAKRYGGPTAGGCH